MTTDHPMSAHPLMYAAALATLNDYAHRGHGRPAAHCTPRELHEVAPRELVESLTALAGHPKAEDLARLRIVRSEHPDRPTRCGLDVPVAELVGRDLSPIVIGATSIGARDAMDAAERDVADCACGVRIDYDHALRIVCGSARPAHECGRANFEVPGGDDE